jgi:hypothetical protein
MSDLNEISDLTHNIPSSTPKLNVSHLTVTVDCEYCGLKYKTIQDKNLHQIYYCIGRDLSLDKSLLKLRNNNNMNKNINNTNVNVNASNFSVKSIANNSTSSSSNSTTTNNVLETNITGTEGLSIKGFKYPSSILKTPRVIKIKNTPDLVKVNC